VSNMSQYSRFVLLMFLLLMFLLSTVWKKRTNKEHTAVSTIGCIDKNN